MTAAVVRIRQERDVRGAPARQEFVQPVTAARGGTLVAAFRDLLAPFELQRPGPDGWRRYRDPARGEGLLRIEGLSAFSLDELDQLLRVEQVSQRIGEHDPHRPAVLGAAAPLALRASNPVIQLVLAAAFALLGLAIGLSPVLNPGAPLVAWIVLPLFGLTALGGAVVMAIVGARRVRWWRRARADVRRRGERMPEHLEILD